MTCSDTSGGSVVVGEAKKETVYTLINLCYNDLHFPHPLSFLPLDVEN